LQVSDACFVLRYGGVFCRELVVFLIIIMWCKIERNPQPAQAGGRPEPNDICLQILTKLYIDYYQGFYLIIRPLCSLKNLVICFEKRTQN